MLVNRLGKKVVLDPSTFSKSGGEGYVTWVKNGKTLYGFDVVAKQYHSKSLKENHEKISLMSAKQEATLLDVAAWPIDILLDKSSNKFCGYIMPFHSGKVSIHMVYGPSSRRNWLPSSDWNFLLVVAQNLARAFAIMHDRDIVVGDVNYNNVLVNNKGEVVLIDCDSFQIKSPRKTFFCKVRIADYMPPELFGMNLSHVVRTANHDNFSLAVLLFQLLFLGRHPFDGTPLTQGAPNLSREESVQRLLFAYGYDATKLGVQPPPRNIHLQLSDLPPTLGALFEKAFSRNHTSTGRPKAAEWVREIVKLRSDIQVCTKNRKHHHPKGVSCAFCRIDSYRPRPIFDFASPGGFFKTTNNPPQTPAQSSPASQAASPNSSPNLQQPKQFPKDSDLREVRTGIIGPECYRERLKLTGLLFMIAYAIPFILKSPFIAIVPALISAGVLAISTAQRVRSLGWSDKSAFWLLLPGGNIALIIALAIAKRKF